jgi:hypothetical protein
MAPSFYPFEIINFVVQMIGVWLFVNILSLFLPGWKRSFASINSWKNQFRKAVFKAVLVISRNEIIEEKNGQVRYSQEKEWGVHFLAAILLPSVIAFVTTSLLYALAHLIIKENIFWGILAFSIAFVSIFAIIPSFEEILSLVKTSTSSSWNWYVKGMGSSILVYGILSLLVVPKEIIYLVIIPLLFFPWTGKNSVVKKTNLSALPQKTVSRQFSEASICFDL